MYIYIYTLPRIVFICISTLTLAYCLLPTTILTYITYLVFLHISLCGMQYRILTNIVVTQNNNVLTKTASDGN